MFRKPTGEQLVAMKKAVEKLPKRTGSTFEIPSIDQLIEVGIISEEQREMVEELRSDKENKKD